MNATRVGLEYLPPCDGSYGLVVRVNILGDPAGFAFAKSRKAARFVARSETCPGATRVSPASLRISHL